MSHLTDEQLEQVLQNNELPEHIKSCEQCRERLAEKKALAGRLRLAFEKVKVAENIEQRIREHINVGSAGAAHARTKSIWDIRSHWRSWSAVAAAAVVLIIAVPITIQLTWISSAHAAQAELVKIHQHNMAGNHEFYSEANPGKLAEYFKDKLGFIPTMPLPDQGLALRGCCVRHFRGRIVGSYVVETDQGVMSVIVVTDKPQSLGMSRKVQNGKQDFWESSFAKCQMVSVRLGEYSYCAVGEVDYDYLTDLLTKLLPGS